MLALRPLSNRFASWFLQGRTLNHIQVTQTNKQQQQQKRGFEHLGKDAQPENYNTSNGPVDLRERVFVGKVVEDADNANQFYLQLCIT